MVEERARRFRRRVRRGVPIGRARIDTAVHDLRTSARRVLAALEAARSLLAAKRLRRLRRRVEAVLDRSGELRDVGVQLQMLAGLGAAAAEPAFADLRERLAERHERLARRLHRRLRRRRGRGLRRDLRRVLKGGDSSKTSGIRAATLEAARDRFARLRRSRLAVNPAELATIHDMRVELKQFRYLMEALRPVAPGRIAAELDSLHRLQTTMGDLHDLEVLSSTIARHVAKVRPEAAAQAASVLETLEQRHSAMLTSFLEAVDPVLGAWEWILGSRRRWAERA